MLVMKNGISAVKTERFVTPAVRSGTGDSVPLVRHPESSEVK